MIEIDSLLNDIEFDDIKKYSIAKEMWDKLLLVDGSDQNVLREKSESLRGKFDDTRTKEGKNIL